MPKTHTRYVCQQCGRVSAGFMGKCPQCGSFNSMVEEIVSDEPAGGKNCPARPERALHPAPPVGRQRRRRRPDPRPDRRVRPRAGRRDRARLDRAGRRRPGHRQVHPDAADGAGNGDRACGCCTSPARNRSGRSRCGRARIASEWQNSRPTCSSSPRPTWRRSSNTCRAVKPDLLIVDSIQTVYLPELDSAAGSVSQVRECANRLRELAKSSGPAVFVIGHVTKEGTIAGPRVLEHIVDTVLYLEGDRFQAYRLLRSVKNRFGATAEVGVFEMRRARAGRGDQPVRGFPGRADGQRGRVGHRRDDGRHPPAAGGGAGADQPGAVRQRPPHPQRRGLQPPADDRRRADPPGGAETGRSRISLSTWWAG